MIARAYQSECFDAVSAAWAAGHRLSDVVLPTGTGKTVVQAKIAHEFLEGRVLIAEPLNELVDQTAAKIAKITGEAPGIEQADRWSNESAWGQSSFVVGSIHTLCGSKDRAKRFRGIHLVMIDEGHLHQPKIDKLLEIFPQAKFLRFTATPGKHHWHRAYTMEIGRAIDDGWLVKPFAQCVQLESLDLSAVRTGKDGDFVEKDLAAVMEEERVVFEVADVVARESFAPDGRKLKTAVYTASVAEARKVAHRLVDAYGIKADWVCGDKNLCPADQRRAVMANFHHDPEGIQVMCNFGVLTIGWDFPGLEHIVVARPTKSLQLFTQIIGRGLRPCEGVVDFAGSTAETRLAAIAASLKPHIKITDLRDNSLSYKLIDTVDALGAGQNEKVRTRAKKELQKEPATVDVVEALRRAVLHEQKLERQRMKRVAAKAKYTRVEADLFDKNQRANPARNEQKRIARIVVGKEHRGKLVTEVPESYLRWIVAKKVGPAWFVKSCAGELYFRSRGINRSQPVDKPPADRVNDLFAEAVDNPRVDVRELNRRPAVVQLSAAEQYVLSTF